MVTFSRTLFSLELCAEYQNGKIVPQDVKIKTHLLVAGEMAQRLRALIVLPEALSSIPSTHMKAHNHL